MRGLTRGRRSGGGAPGGAAAVGGAAPRAGALPARVRQIGRMRTPMGAAGGAVAGVGSAYVGTRGRVCGR